MADMSERVLLIAPFVPTSAARHGGARALHGLVSALARRHCVTLLHLAGAEEPDPAVVAACVAVEPVQATARRRLPWRARAVVALARGRTLWDADPALGALRRRANEIAHDFEPTVVQVEHAFLADVMPAHPAAAARVVTVHDPAASQAEVLAASRDPTPLVRRLEARAAMRQERRALRRADAVAVFSERDRQVLERSSRRRAEIVRIALGADVPPVSLDPLGAPPPAILFVGSFRHPPNCEAAIRLATRILPLVRAHHPGVVLELVGEAPPRDILALRSNAGVHVAGNVASVEPFLDRAAVVVAPLATGGGMRVKVLEALAAGKAVVASGRGAEGIVDCGSDHLVVADGNEATAAALDRLLADPVARAELAGRARAWAERELGWDRMADRYDELYGRLRARPRHR